MTIDETITALDRLTKMLPHLDNIAIVSAIEHLEGIRREMREAAMNRAIDMCQGRHKNDRDDAFDADVIVQQADIFYKYTETGATE